MGVFSSNVIRWPTCNSLADPKIIRALYCACAGRFDRAWDLLFAAGYQRGERKHSNTAAFSASATMATGSFTSLWTSMQDCYMCRC